MKPGRFASTLACLWSFTGSVGAFDVGDPLFRGSPLTEEEVDHQPNHRFEVLYDSLDRDVSVQINSIRAGTPEGGPVGSFVTPASSQSSVDGDTVIFRYIPRISELFSAQLDLGVSSSSGSDSLFIVGGAGRVLLVESDVFQLSTQLAGHYVPSYDTVETGQSDDFGSFVANGEEEFYEVGVALLGSFELPMKNEWIATVYMGPRFSMLRGNSSAVVDYENPIIVDGATIGTRAWFDADLEETSVVGGVVGFRVDYTQRWSGRVEGRFIDETSFSSTLSASF